MNSYLFLSAALIFLVGIYIIMRDMMKAFDH